MSRPRIGIFDSGLGGLTVLHAVRNVLPQADLIYLGDTARTPYGNKSKSTIERYSLECARFLLRQEVEMLIVACNTASSVALEALRVQTPCPVIGTIEPAVQSCLAILRGQTVGIIGTHATIASRVYERRLHEIAPHLRVVSKACPLFVPLVEEGMFEGEVSEKIIDLYLRPLETEGLEVLILACTHYPLLQAAIARRLGDAVRIVDCAHAIARGVKSHLETTSEASGSGSTQYFVTDEPSRFNALVSLLSAGEIKAVQLGDLSA